jgi:hypothetical protein
MRNGLFAEQGVCIVDAEAGGVEDNENFRKQGLDDGLAGLGGDQAGDAGFFLMQKALKFAEGGNAWLDSESMPVWLGGTGAGNGRKNLRLGNAIQFAENLAGRRIDRGHFSRRDLEIGNHWMRKVYAGEGDRATGSAFVFDVY